MQFSFSVFISLAVIAGTVMAQDKDITNAKNAFDNADIPKDLNLNFDPKAPLQVKFPQLPPTGSKSVPAPIPIPSSGADLPKSEISQPPAFCLPSPQPEDLGKGPFVIAIVDPDAPTPQNRTEGPFRHFLGGDFMLKDDGTSLVNSTPAITEYQQPSPQSGSESHRVVFLLFKQPDGFKDQKDVTVDTGRPSFDISKFAQNAGLGEPVAGTYMRVGPTSQN